MLMHTSSAHAPWYIVDANVKRHARLNVISHLLSKIPYEDLTPERPELPPRQEAGDYAQWIILLIVYTIVFNTGVFVPGTIF